MVDLNFLVSAAFECVEGGKYCALNFSLASESSMSVSKLGTCIRRPLSDFLGFVFLLLCRVALSAYGVVTCFFTLDGLLQGFLRAFCSCVMRVYVEVFYD
ncbi:hypothetical protein KC19_2G210900 [Ceratodon purpureus]|uniref:Uncharacterized protein n=1 Tax=Ceratodon purpureus TaxID=3225 RepID=A0A8T0IYH4_CERPU|nr:hypothetical protein KC19_2G210900 [Ceratodon purpureus]